ncbi:unnamed protein product [Alternaria alternata]
MVVRPYFTDDKRVLPFEKVIELERIDDRTFRSIVKAYSPTGGENGTYGGHVFAQAAWAAAQTVEEGEETSPFDVQEDVDLRDLYKDTLEDKADEPMEHPAAPSNDSEYFRETYLPAHPEHFNPVAGLHIRKADMTDYNRSRHPLDRKQLTFYTLRGSLPLPTAPYPPPSDSDQKFALTREANMHACAHLYASDRNSLFIVPNHLGRPRDYTRMASLSHSVVFHVGSKDLLMTSEPRIDHPNADPTLWEDGSLPLCNLEEHKDGDKDGRKWFVQEAWLTRATGGRALHTSRMWDYKRGVHIATTFQDGLIRFKKDAKL